MENTDTDIFVPVRHEKTKPVIKQVRPLRKAYLDELYEEMKFKKYKYDFLEEKDVNKVKELLDNQNFELGS